jgi:alpha-L-fucosidase
MQSTLPSIPLHMRVNMRLSISALAMAAVLTLGYPSGASGQHAPAWQSLDRRPTPQWWTDAKFGIFIHWGVYSVPAFSKLGEYSEWYWHSLQSGKPDYVAFHNRMYGGDFAYADFVPSFKAEFFEPDQWASLFQRSGARYVVLTSKHHDGYTLWKNQQANQSWGRAWNSVDTGPKRDLVGDLSTAVRKAGLRMGLYYSLYEWFNPLYKTDVNLFVDKHYIPQFKDVVTRYRPSIIFADGEWEHPSKTWKSEEVLAWLFSESPVKDEVVVNDRWGKETRHKHGGYFTTEYGSGLPNAAHAWEENRGMAHSFGYSRTENLADYNTAQQLVLMLVDIVSRGGNFLLDIGPTADGRVPVIMQERLLQMGEWLRVNGEAIYGTQPWKVTTQWSEGQIQDAERGQYKAKYDILKLTVDPDSGKAVKEILFTRKSGTLYAITPRFPRGQLTVKGVQLAPGAEVTLLGHGKPLSWRQSSGNVVVDMPPIAPDELPTEHAYTFKLTNIRP